MILYQPVPTLIPNGSWETMLSHGGQLSLGGKYPKLGLSVMRFCAAAIQDYLGIF